MVVLLTFAGALSGALALVALLPFGWFVALLGAPCAASAFVLGLATIAASARRPSRPPTSAGKVAPELAA
jgi:hypothetical protein